MDKQEFDSLFPAPFGTEEAMRDIRTRMPLRDTRDRVVGQDG